MRREEALYLLSAVEELFKAVKSHEQVLMTLHGALADENTLFRDDARNRMQALLDKPPDAFFDATIENLKAIQERLVSETEE